MGGSADLQRWYEHLVSSGGLTDIQQIAATHGAGAVVHTTDMHEHIAANNAGMGAPYVPGDPGGPRGRSYVLSVEAVSLVLDLS